MRALRTILIACIAGAGVTAGAATADTGPQVWSRAGCGGCHTLAAAGSYGDGGPNLDQLRPSAAAVAAQVAGGGGGMPSFGGTLSSAQIDAVAAYVSAAAGGSTSAAGAGPAARSTAAQLGLSARTVKILQRDLKTLHYFGGPVTGFYGPLTTAAVKHFQAANGLQADGLWGPHSESVLKRLLRHR